MMTSIRVAAVSFTAVIMACGLVTAGEPKPALWTYHDLVDGKIPQPFAIRPSHPRLLITAENKPEIVEKIREAPAIWCRVIEEAERGSGEDLVLACGAIYQVGLVRGFRYPRSREAYGHKGVAELMTFDFAKNRGGGTGNWGCGLLMAPLGYDWLYDLLSEDQKRELVRRMVALKSHEEFVEGFNSPGGAGMLLGLAFYGDGVDDAAAKELVDTYWDIWWNPHTDQSRNLAALLRYLEGGGNTEGLGYFQRNWPFFRTIAAWKTATGQDYFAHMGYFRVVPYWMAHSFVPARRGEPLYPVPFAKWHASREATSNPRLNLLVGTATGYLKDVDPQGAALARWWVDRFRGYTELGLVNGLLIGDPRVPPRSPAELDLDTTLVMRGLNNVYMRSGWNDPDVTVVAFANTRFLMRGASSNCFSLWKNRGALFLYRGLVARHQYWGEHGEWPLNTPVFYQDRSLVKPLHASRLRPAAEAGRLEVGTLAVASQPHQYDYARGTCPKAYGAPEDSSVDAKVQEAERTLVYLRPTGNDRSDFVVLLDRLKADSQRLRPHVVFQTVFEPKIGKDWQEEDKGEVVHEGQWAIGNAPCVTVTNNHFYDFGKGRGFRAHARAFLKTLFPREIRTLKIGGEEHFMDGLHGRGSEDDRFYRTFRNARRNDQVLAGGYWRFHVLPTQASADHTMLTAIEATDSRARRPSPMELLEGEGCLAARVGPNIVVFSRDGNTLAAASATALAEPWSGRIVIGDLAPSNDYRLFLAGTSITTKATEAGTLCVPNARLPAGDTLRIEASVERQEKRQTQKQTRQLGTVIKGE
jgi:hypothetical protein